MPTVWGRRADRPRRSRPEGVTSDPSPTDVDVVLSPNAANIRIHPKPHERKCDSDGGRLDEMEVSSMNRARERLVGQTA